MSGNLVDFLRARLDEDEQMARDATQGPWFWPEPDTSEWPQGDVSLLADESPPNWQTCMHHCTWTGAGDLHRGTPGQPGAHEHRMVTEVIGSWGYDAHGVSATTADSDHIARWDPARVLAEVQAKQRILDEHQQAGSDLYAGEAMPWCSTCSGGRWPCMTLRLLALPYASHPGYRAAWAPDSAT